MKRVPSILKRARQQAAAHRGYSPAANLSAPGFTASLTVPSIAGILVTPQTALTFTAWYAATKVLTEDSASLDLVVFQRQKDGSSTAEWNHPVSELFNDSPDGECTDMNWRESYTSQALGWGTSYAEITFDPSGYPTALNMMHPSLILPKRTREGALFYELQTAIQSGNDTRNKVLPPWKVLNLPLLGFNGLVGYSPVALCRESIGLGKAAEQFGASLFGNGAMPNGVLTAPGKLKDEARKNLRESWNLVHQGSASANKIALLEEGITWAQTSISPELAQFLATRQFQVIEVCRIFRLPPHKLGDFTKADLANFEVANEDYLQSCLRPLTRRIEKAIRFKLLTKDEKRAGFYLKHDFRPLILTLSKDRADYYRKLAEIGIYTPSEIAVLEGLNPIDDADGGNKRFRPANLVELDAETPIPSPNSAPKGPPEPDANSLNRVFGALTNGHV